MQSHQNGGGEGGGSGGALSSSDLYLEEGGLRQFQEKAPHRAGYPAVQMKLEGKSQHTDATAEVLERVWIFVWIGCTQCGHTSSHRYDNRKGTSRHIIRNGTRQKHNILEQSLDLFYFFS